MVSEAEQYKEEDEKQKERIVARNQLENYIFSVKQAVGDFFHRWSTCTIMTVLVIITACTSVKFCHHGGTN
jgi:L1 cell adhesion molecule like protein